MGSGIYVAMAGAVAQTQALDTVANNIANAGTTGFRAERCHFGEALSRARSKSVAYVQEMGGATDVSAGPRTETGNPLDVALTGDGYLTVDTARGMRLTRNGALQLDDAGRLVTHDGNAVLGVDGKPIVATRDDVASVLIGADGTVSAGDHTLGKIDLVSYAVGDVKREGESLYVPTGQPIVGAKPELAVGELEQGNFNIVTGMVDLVRITRNYEALHRMLESYKEIDNRIAQVTSQ